MKRKIISLLLAFVMVITLLPVTALAEEQAGQEEKTKELVFGQAKYEVTEIKVGGKPISVTGNVPNLNNETLTDLIKKDLANSAVAEFDKTNIEKAVDAEKYEGKSLQVVANLAAVEVASKTNLMITKMTYDVKPMADSEEIPQADIQDNITFLLPVPDNFGDNVMVIHKHEVGRSDIGLVGTKGETGNKYIELSVKNFSEFELIPAIEFPTLPFDLKDAAKALVKTAVFVGGVAVATDVAVKVVKAVANAVEQAKDNCTAADSKTKTSTKTSTKVVSADTADMGVILYGVMAVSSVLGMGWVAKKKHD